MLDKFSIQRPLTFHKDITNNTIKNTLPFAHLVKRLLSQFYNNSLIMWDESEIPSLLSKKAPFTNSDFSGNRSWLLFDRSPIRSCAILSLEAHTNFQNNLSQSLCINLNEQLISLGIPKNNFHIQYIEPKPIKKNNAVYTALCVLSWKPQTFLLESERSTHEFQNIIQEYKKDKGSFYYQPPTPTKHYRSIQKEDSKHKQKSISLLKTWVLGTKNSVENRKYFLSHEKKITHFSMCVDSNNTSNDLLNYLKRVKREGNPLLTHKRSLLEGINIPRNINLKIQNDGSFSCSNQGLRAILWKQQTKKFLYIPDTVKIDSIQGKSKISFRILKGHLQSGDALIFLPENIDKVTIINLLKNSGSKDNLQHKSRFRDMISNRLNQHDMTKSLMIDFCHIKNSN